MAGLRIAFVHRVYGRGGVSGGAGGVEGNVVVLAEGMAARGHEVSVLAARFDQEPPAGARAIEVGEARFRARVNVDFDRRAARELERSGPFDVVQGFDLTTRQDVLRVGRGLLAVYRRVLAAERTPPERLIERLSIKHGLMERLERRMFAPGSFRVVVANSHRLKGEIEATYGVPAEKIEVIWNGVDLRRFTPEGRAERGARAREELGIPAGVPLCLHVGNGFRRKGLATLLEALARIRRQRPDARLLVAGRDPHQARYVRMASELGIGQAVVFAGATADVEGCYAAADVLALPTRYDPFPNVVLEALASGLPAVVSRVSGASEVLEEGLPECVLGVPSDAAELARRIEAVLADARGTRELPPIARSIAERHSIEAMLDRYEALYRSLAPAGSALGEAGAEATGSTAARASTPDQNLSGSPASGASAR